MAESSDPVEECVCQQLQNNDESLVNLCFDIIPEIYADGELDEDGDEVEYEAKNVDDEVIRIIAS